MNEVSDQQLIRDYAESRSEEAFGMLVRRHVDFVYSGALRMVHDSHLAKDVTQAVFIALAQSAGQLTNRTVLSGWLHRTTQNTAANVVRTDVRRRAREEKAIAMNELLSAGADAPWENIAPHLDDALRDLNEPDRDALLLRYFERKSAHEMARTLGISDEAAQKRVHRALERLRDLFSKRGITVGTTAIVAAISSSAVHAAPLGLSASISSGAILSGLAIHSTTAVTATNAIIMTTLQKTIVATIIIASITVPLVVQHQAKEKLRSENQSLRLQIEENDKLKAVVARLSNHLAKAEIQGTALPPAEYAELLKLRGQATQAQTATRELAALKEKTARQNLTTDALRLGGTKLQEKAAAAKLARMKEFLALSPEQEEAIQALQFEKIRNESQFLRDAMEGKVSKETSQAAGRSAKNLEEGIEGLLTPEQLAAYPDYKQSEIERQAREAANHEVVTLAEDFGLSPEQQEQAYNALYQQNMEDIATTSKTKSSPGFVSTDPKSAAAGSEWRRASLEQKLKALEGILTPEQINTYREEKLAQIEQTIVIKRTPVAN